MTPIASFLTLQQSAGNQGVHRLVGGGGEDAIPRASLGQALDAETRAFMESRFDEDFQHVRIHTDAAAGDAAKALKARAYTSGPHIVFARGQYAPATPDGRHLLAHELAHVAQQSRRRAPGGAAGVSDPSGPEERAAHHAADLVAGGHGRVGDALIDADPGVVYREPENPGIPSPEAAVPAPVVAEFDVDPSSAAKGWNVDGVAKELVAWVDAAPTNTVLIFGNFGGESGQGEEGAAASGQAARKRAEAVKKVLIQKAPRLKGRLSVSTMDRDQVGATEGFLHQVTIMRGPIPGVDVRNPVGPVSAPPARPGPFADEYGPPPEPPPYLPGTRPTGFETFMQDLVREQPPKPGEQPSEFEKFFDQGLGFWNQDTVTLGFKGMTIRLFKGGGVEVKATFGTSFKMEVKRGSASVSGSVSYTGKGWEVRVSLPGDTAPADQAKFEQIMARAKEAVLKLAAKSVDPKTFERFNNFIHLDDPGAHAVFDPDLMAFIDEITPLVDPIRFAVEQIQGMRKIKPGVSYGLAAGSGGGPGSQILTPEQNATAIKDFYVRGVVTLYW